MSRTVLVTGAFGNIGQNTVQSLLDARHTVVALDRETPANTAAANALVGKVTVIWGDVTDRNCLESALSGVDVVIHLAALTPPATDRQPDLAQKINVDATLAIIELMEASDRARRLVFASSVAVFGNRQDREPPLRVDTPLTPVDLYGRTKVACEAAIRESSLRWSILRIAAAPPTEILHTASTRVGFDASADARVEFVFSADAGLAFAKAVDCDDCVGKTLYIGGGEKCRYTQQQLLSEINEAVGLGPLPTEAFLQADVPTFFGDWVDTAESERLLGYQRHDLDDYKNEIRKLLGARRFLLRIMRPLAMRKLLSKSHYAENTGTASP